MIKEIQLHPPSAPGKMNNLPITLELQLHTQVILKKVHSVVEEEVECPITPFLSLPSTHLHAFPALLHCPFLR